MPELDWDETDFMECLEVEPVIEDFEISHTYDVLQPGIRLLVTVWQHESVVQISLVHNDSEQPLMSFACFVRGLVEYVNDKRGKFIRLANCMIGPTRFWYQQVGDLFSSEVYPHGVDVHIGIEPSIFVDLVSEKD